MAVARIHLKGPIGEVEDLGWWDSRYGHVLWHGTSELGIEPTPTAQLSNLIFDFGAWNLYTVFDVERTAGEHRRLIDHLSKELGLVIEVGEPLGGWCLSRA